MNIKTVSSLLINIIVLNANIKIATSEEELYNTAICAIPINVNLFTNTNIFLMI